MNKIETNRLSVIWVVPAKFARPSPPSAWLHCTCAHDQPGREGL